MDEADVIIVGAGSAGCVLADRLSADGRLRVVLLEAGGSDRRLFVQMPMGYGKLFMDPKVNWMHATEPDPGLNGQRDHWPRGKVLGGSSSINAMVWARGHAEDYEDWRRAGNPGWGWAEVLAAYRAFEDNEDGAGGTRGVGGPLRVSSMREGLHPLTHAFLAAARAAGLPDCADFNVAEPDGVGVYQLTVAGGRRNSAARAFLRPAMGRSNLRVMTRAHATRVVTEGRRAVGVEVLRGGQRQVIRAREVILSGGAINSPQLLLLSGIGPGAALQGMGLPVVLDQPHVGRNLSDHQGLNYTWRANVPTLNEVLRPWWGKLRVGVQYLLTGTGPLARSINQAGGFFRTRPGLARPNMQLYFQAFSTLLPRAGERPILSPDPWPGMSIGLSNARPSSRGWLELASPDPLAKPRITGNAYATAEDLQEMLEAVRFIRKIAAQQPLAGFIAEELRPGAQAQTDAAVIDDLRQRSGTVFHPSGTARMGPDAATAVVDARCRVHGMDGLRVIDASVFPNLITGNTNAPAMAVGWIGAEKVREDLR
jgi:choline dehydrogenase